MKMFVNSISQYSSCCWLNLHIIIIQFYNWINCVQWSLIGCCALSLYSGSIFESHFEMRAWEQSLSIRMSGSTSHLRYKDACHAFAYQIIMTDGRERTKDCLTTNSNQKSVNCSAIKIWMLPSWWQNHMLMLSITHSTVRKLLLNEAPER